jgi:enamine deaminase RidA (YjgF/YER057c/UK114 family)
MLQPISANPETDRRLAYSQGMLSHGQTRTLFISGQVGVDRDGVVPASFEDQVRQAWANLLAVLGAADMKVGDLAKLTVYLTSQSDFASYAALRGEFLGSHKPASTAVIAAGLALPDWKFEIEAIAVAPV